MRIDNMRKRFVAAEREYLIWKYSVEFYDKYINKPLPENLIDAAFIAYLLTDKSVDACKLLNDNGYRTERGTKITTNDLSYMITENKAWDENLTFCVKGVFEFSKKIATRYY